MTKEETLVMLDSLINDFESMTDSQLADYLWNESECFRQDVINCVNNCLADVGIKEFAESELKENKLLYDTGIAGMEIKGLESDLTAVNSVEMALAS